MDFNNFFVCFPHAPAAGGATPGDAKAKKLKRGSITVTGDEDSYDVARECLMNFIKNSLSCSGPNIRLELSFAAKNLDKKDLFGKSGLLSSSIVITNSRRIIFYYCKTNGHYCRSFHCVVTRAQRRLNESDCKGYF